MGRDRSGRAAEGQAVGGCSGTPGPRRRPPARRGRTFPVRLGGVDQQDVSRAPADVGPVVTLQAQWPRPRGGRAETTGAVPKAPGPRSCRPPRPPRRPRPGTGPAGPEQNPLADGGPGGCRALRAPGCSAQGHAGWGRQRSSTSPCHRPVGQRGEGGGSHLPGTGQPVRRQAGLPLAPPGLTGGSWAVSNHLTLPKLQQVAPNPICVLRWKGKPLVGSRRLFQGPSQGA